MHAHERRRHFIDAALHLFSTRGFRGTTTKAIAAAAGVSEGLLFRHFSTKEDLYTAILQEKARQAGFDVHLATLERHARRGDDARLVLEVVRTIVNSYRRDPDFERLMLYAALEGHELATASQRIFGRPLFEFFARYVVERQEAGIFRAGDPTLLTFGLFALPAYFGLVTQLFGWQMAKGSDREVVELFARLILDGLRSGVEPVAAPAPARKSRSRTTQHS
jgi:TetR/AcrR family transcriptional regulator